ncbi:MAG: hypothetical protein LBG58_06640 [Planctomycetaceae bacterium]|nr:hypothetical protein [Planctomycetaceae bacterium]
MGNNAGVYESLDPNCCVLVEEINSKRIAGSCFFHPRPRHVSLGILNTRPDFFGNGVASNAPVCRWKLKTNCVQLE